jgi:hypothetical protein
MMLSLLKPSVSSSGVAASKLSRKDVFEAAKLKKSFRAQCAESVRCYYGYLRRPDEVFVTERGKREENQVVKTDGRATGARCDEAAKRSTFNQALYDKWLKDPQHAWLGLSDTGGMTCALCISAQCKNAFTGSGCFTFQVGKVKAHRWIGDHAKAAEAFEAAALAAAAAPVPPTAMEAHIMAKQAELLATRAAAGEVAYALAKLPTAPQTYFKPLMGALDRAAKRLGATLQATSEYRHDNGSRDWMMKYSHLLSEDRQAALRDSRFIAIGCDESSDKAIKSNMVVYIYFVRKGSAKVEFFRIFQLHGASAAELAKELVALLKEEGLLAKLIALGSDGRLLDEVNDRMPDNAVIRSFLCYDARDLPEGPLPPEYGEADIELQIAYFAPESMDKSRNTFECYPCTSSQF